MARGRAVVTGMIASYPVGGVAWDYGQYALGLEQLGFEVFYLEDTGWQTYDPVARTYGDDCTYGVRFLAATLGRLSPDLGARWCFRSPDGRRFGPVADEIGAIVSSADLFLNVSGGTLLRDEYMRCRRKILIDTDPGWNHFRNYPTWDALDAIVRGDRDTARALLESSGNFDYAADLDGWLARSYAWRESHGFRSHDHFFTYAERMGRDGCNLPSLGLPWQPTRPPVVLDRWRAHGAARTWTTVMTWKNFHQPMVFGGIPYGTKELEFTKVEYLPQHVRAAFEVAVGGADAPTERWTNLGWTVQDSYTVSTTLEAYRDYIQQSRGEFSVAKNLYVTTRSGWFSCRSACYLASSRPVVVQDTGFSEIIPTGSGLLAFTDGEGAALAVETVEREYAAHQRGAREIAETYFDANLVVSDFLRRTGVL